MTYKTNFYICLCEHLVGKIFLSLKLENIKQYPKDNLTGMGKLQHRVYSRLQTFSTLDHVRFSKHSIENGFPWYSGWHSYFKDVPMGNLVSLVWFFNLAN